MNKGNIILLWIGTSLILLALAVTGWSSLLGALIGYWVGFIYIGWLYRDTMRSLNLDVIAAVKRMRRSFFARLGMVTLIVAGVARVQVVTRGYSYPRSSIFSSTQRSLF